MSKSKVDFKEQKRVALAIQILELEKSPNRNQDRIIELKQRFDRMWD